MAACLLACLRGRVSLWGFASVCFLPHLSFKEGGGGATPVFQRIPYKAGRCNHGLVGACLPLWYNVLISVRGAQTSSPRANLVLF